MSDGYELNAGLYDPDRQRARFTPEQTYEVTSRHESGSGLCEAVSGAEAGLFRHCNGKTSGIRYGKRVCLSHWRADVVRFLR